MTTLYELLGALPHDDAEGLRTAFRKAAKATHPDTNPDDPEASLRFRQLVRAHDILTDEEQRAAYDQLLALALREPGAKSKHTAIYETIQKLATNTIAATIISGVLVAGYALFVPMSQAPAVSERSIDLAPRQTIEVAALAPIVQSTAQPDTIARVEPRDAREEPAAADDVMTTGTVWPADGTQPVAHIDLVPDLPVNDAKSYRRRGIYAYRDGDLSRALADFDLAIQRDPNYAEAYVDRGIVLYRMRQFDRAFADMTRAKRIGNANRTTTPAPMPAAAPHRPSSPVRVHDAINVAASDRFVAASDRFLDVPSQSMPLERRR
jgi:tetratricopeptide (TPR) repeat protein